MIHVKNNMGGSEKRRTPRLYQTLDATLSQGDLLNHRALCKNISEGGVCLEVEFEEVNERALWVIRSKDIKINIEISLVDGQDKVKALAIIRWHKEISSAEAKKFSLGMEFIEIDTSVKNRLSPILHNFNFGVKNILFPCILVKGNFLEKLNFMV